LGGGNAARQGLQRLGWEEGRNILIDVRFPAADAGKVRAILTELMSLAPDVLITNTNLVTAVVQAEVRTVPIVFISVGDPVGAGFVSDEARPTGNLTGFANWRPSLGEKWLELLKEIAPQVERVGILMHPEEPINALFFKFAEAAAPALKVKPVALAVHDADEIKRTLTAFATERDRGFIVIPHAVTLINRDLIVALATRLRLPALYPFAFYAKAGGLMSYSFDPLNQFRRGAEYVDRIMRGAKPADLPVQYPTKFQLVVNLTTATALGLPIPASVLSLADEMVE
jgi:putative ABC transport system substrate-binding protein